MVSLTWQSLHLWQWWWFHVAQMSSCCLFLDQPGLAVALHSWWPDCLVISSDLPRLSVTYQSQWFHVSLHRSMQSCPQSSHQANLAVAVTLLTVWTVLMAQANLAVTLFAILSCVSWPARLGYHSLTQMAVLSIVPYDMSLAHSSLCKVDCPYMIQHTYITLPSALWPTKFDDCLISTRKLVFFIWLFHAILHMAVPPRVFFFNTRRLVVNCLVVTFLTYYSQHLR
jgi:uncharacterized membrane protein